MKTSYGNKANIKRFIMSGQKDDKIEDVLVDSELAKKLVPNKFKFTSQ